MPTIIGTDILSSISRRHIFPKIIDGIYPTNALFARLNAANKKGIAGGMHIEQPFIHSTFSNGGAYEGYEVLDTSPNDTIINGGWDIKQYYVPVTIDGRTLARANTAEAVANILTVLWDQAKMDLADKLGTGVYSDTVTNTKEMDGLKGIVDDGTVAASYAGLTRATYPFLNGKRDATTGTLTLATVEAMVSNCTIGGYAPTIILSRQEQYRRIWALLVANQRFITGPGSRDEQLGSAGFTNLLFDNIPWVIDSKVFDGPDTSNSAILFLNERTLKITTWSDEDFVMQDFVRPHNQNAMVGFLHWYGNLICDLPKVNGVMSNVSA